MYKFKKPGRPSAGPIIEGETVHFPEPDHTSPPVMEWTDEKASRYSYFQEEVMYADFESKLENADEQGRRKHTANVRALVVTRRDGSVVTEVTRHTLEERPGRSTAVAMLLDMKKLAYEIIGRRQAHRAVPDLTAEEQKAFDATTHCPSCKKAFGEEQERVKCRDHCHNSGAYRGPLCCSCNRFKTMREGKVPVLFHNLSGYDGRLIIEGLAELTGEDRLEDISVLATNGQKYKTITWGPLKFIDFLQHRTAALDKLVSTQRGEYAGAELKARFPATFQVYGEKGFTDEEIERELIGKTPYPYSYFDSDDSKLRETSLPPPEFFANDLEGETACKPAVYEKAQRLWALGEAKWEARGARWDLGEFAKLYCALDVTLLSDIGTEYRNSTYAAEQIDPLHFLTFSSCQRQVMLKYATDPISLYTKADLDVALLLRKEMRGGITHVGRKTSTANNRYCPGYDPTREAVWNAYVDHNSLYPTIMADLLPYTVPQLQMGDWTVRRIMGLPDEGEYGYNIRYSAHFPRATHDFFRQIAPLMEKCELADAQLSPHTKAQRERGGLGTVSGATRLLGTLLDKPDITSDFRVFKWLVSKGMEVPKIHGVYRFKQSKWMEPFITKCVKARSEATSEVIKQQEKDAMTSQFGKTMQDPMKQRTVKLAMTDQKRKRLQNRFDFEGMAELGRNSSGDYLYAMEMRMTEVMLDQPSYVGFTILERSKLRMLVLFYDVLVPLWGAEGKTLELLYMDTDSMVLRVVTADHGWDMYRDMASRLDVFDLTKYESPDTQLHAFWCREQKKNQLGLLKDDLGYPLYKWVALTQKCYSCQVVKGATLAEHTLGEKKVGKGVPRHLLQKTPHDTFEAIHAVGGTGREKGAQFKGITMMRSRDHRVFTCSKDRVGLSSVDVKRWRLPDGDSLPYGHYLAV